MNDEILLIYLRDCFTAGYTLPQFCIDNGIKKTLIVAPNTNYWKYVWEIYVQFKYDKRISAEFALLNDKIDSMEFSVHAILGKLKVKNLSEIEGEFNKIIFLTAQKFNINPNITIYLDTLADYFIRRTYADIPLLNFLNNHAGVKLFAMSFPCILDDENYSEREKKLFSEIGLGLLGKTRANIESNVEGQIETPYDFLGYSNKEVYDLLETPEVKNNFDGSTSLKDNPENFFMQIHGGKRFTPNQPETYTNKIYFIGNCVYYGYGVPYDKTVESYLQNFLNLYNLPYRVENEAQVFGGRYQDIFYNLNNLPVKAGDIIFINLQNMVPASVPFIDTSSIFRRPHNYGEVFADNGHINELGHKALAEYFFNLLTQNKFFKYINFKYPPPPTYSTSLWNTKRKFNIPADFFTKCGVGGIQEKIA